MKVLLDEDLPHDLRHHLVGHDVFTVRYLRWDSLKNGTLLRTAEENLFEVFVTGDQNLTKQQNTKDRKLGFVTLTSQRLEVLLANLAAVRAAVDAAQPGTEQIVECVESGRI